jgi:hypothetical protein
MRRATPLILALALALSMAGCGSGSTTTTALSTTTTAAPTTTTTIPTTTTTPGVPILPLALEEMPATWALTFTIPYGETSDTLGTYLGGDGEGLQIGPDYGAQGPDGTWWFLDTAKYRLAHFSETGEYLEEVVIPESMLVQGIYFQYQLPRVLDNGMMIASRLSGDRTVFVRYLDGILDEVAFDRSFIPRADDGRLLYGFDWEASQPVVADLETLVVTNTEWFIDRAGNRYQVSAGPGGMRVELPDASPPAVVDLPFEAEELGGGAYVSAEVASDNDGALHFFLLGFPELDESRQLAGYLTITADGTVGPIEPMRNPFSPADPASPARLGVRPGTSDPWIMFIDPDGVKVYHRS